MNKKEAIEKLTNKANGTGWVAYKSARNIVEQIHEPQKVVVPKCVAEWIEECKSIPLSLDLAFNSHRIPEEVGSWLIKTKSQDTFARAWLDGYEIEQEKLYKVEFSTGQRLYKNHPNGSSTEQIVIKFAHHADKDGHFTNKELEEAGYGWVFDCKGVKVEEVE
ncbi:DUF1642 domain-containing protein [Streptococcus orisratti]